MEQELDEVSTSKLIFEIRKSKLSSRNQTVIQATKGYQHAAAFGCRLKIHIYFQSLDVTSYLTVLITVY